MITSETITPRFIKSKKNSHDLKKGNTPRRKHLDRTRRLESAKNWIPTYSGKNIVKGYSNWYGVDLLCSMKELRMSGVVISEDYRNKVVQSIQKRRFKKQANSEPVINTDQDEYGDFIYIAGFTSGGAPYGITHEDSVDFEIETKSNDVNSKDSINNNI